MKVPFLNCRAIALFTIVMGFLQPSILNAQIYSIPPKFDYASSFSEGLAIVRVGNKYGYINPDGKLVIPLTDYDNVYPFSEGYARVLKGKKFGFIDKAGRLVIDFKYGYASEFKDGLSVISYEDLSLGNMFQLKKGAINKNGKVVINPYLGVLFNFNNGIAVANFGFIGDPSVGVINKSGEVLTPGKFEYITRFQDGIAAALTTDNGWGLISPDGKWISPPHFDGISHFQEGLAVFVDCGGKIHKPYNFSKNLNCKAGYIDNTGKIVIQPQFSSAEEFSESRAAVSFSVFNYHGSSLSMDINSNALFGFIDKTGLITVEPIYKEVRPFKNGVAAVRKPNRESKNEKWGFIDRDGKELTSFIYSYAGSYSEGLAPVKTSSGKWGFIRFQ